MHSRSLFPEILDRLVGSGATQDPKTIWNDFDNLLAPLGLRSVHYESGIPSGDAESCLKTQTSVGMAFGDLVCKEFMEAVQKEPDIYAADDFVRHCQASALPLTFDTDLKIGDSKAPLQRVKDLARDFSVTGGIVVPLHGFADQTFGNVTFILDKHTEVKSTSMVVAELTALAHTINGALMHVSRPLCDDLADVPALSQQQLVCLSWVAKGMSTKRLAHRMGISEATANEYICNACRKLRATTRAEATAKAVALGLIQL